MFTAYQYLWFKPLLSLPLSQLRLTLGLVGRDIRYLGLLLLPNVR